MVRLPPCIGNAVASQRSEFVRGSAFSLESLDKMVWAD
jgi:hypothetical protein